MAENKKSFLLYTDLIKMVNELPNEKAGELFKIILEYVNDLNPIIDDLLLRIAFEPIKQQLKRDLKKWESQHQQRIDAGLRSAEVRKRNATLVNARSISSTVSVNVSGNVNVNKEKTKYVYNEFYDNELKNSNEDKNYKIFIGWLFGDNYLKRPLTNVLSMREQMNFEQFKSFHAQYKLIMEDSTIKTKPKVFELLIELEDWVVLDKKNKLRTLAGMLRTFMKRNVIKKY